MIHHAIPADLLPLEGSQIGANAPGVDVSPMQTGPTTSRRWQNLILRTYSWTLALFTSSSDYLEQWERFLYLTGINANPIWIIEPISGRHNGVQCGGLADGTQTTFPLPAQSASAVSIFIDDAFIDSAYFPIHSAANLLDDATADASDAALWTATGCVVADETRLAAHGSTSLEITPSAAATCSITMTSPLGSVSEYRAYFANVAIRGPHTVKIKIEWRSSAHALIGASTSTGVAGSSSLWKQVTLSDSSPAATSEIKIVIEIDSPSTTDPIFIDCIGFGPGDLDSWWLPSQSPAAIELTSAPAENARVTAHVTGYRMARCRLSKPTYSWSLSSQGHAAPQRWAATEEVWK